MVNVSNVKHTPSPSEEVIANANKAVLIADKKGRKILLVKPSILVQYQLVEMLGDLAKNESYVAMVMPVFYVKEIDGHPIGKITSKIELEALIQRLDEEGIQAVMEGLQQHFITITTEEEFKDAVKK